MKTAAETNVSKGMDSYNTSIYHDIRDKSMKLIFKPIF